ncbi:hypothetical protein IJF91_01695 [Candidatus Saccharibacteria bacterium]|nr:hypothetical protein [Candidatus Saccharibacteria bacterium]
MKKMTRILLLTVCFSLLLVSAAKAAPPPETSSVVMTEEELANHNLSLGTISWNDDICSGKIIVKPGTKDGTYTVTMNAFYKFNDLIYGLNGNKNQLKEFAKNAAKSSFKDVRTHAQTKGWWDCRWKIKSASKNKVKAVAKIEYKAVKVDEKSKEITIKQTTVKKNGKWKTTYTVGGKTYSPSEVKKLF